MWPFRRRRNQQGRDQPLDNPTQAMIQYYFLTEKLRETRGDNNKLPILKEMVDLAPIVIECMKAAHERDMKAAIQRQKAGRALAPFKPYDFRPPSSPGHQGLAIILERRHDFEGARRLCLEAKKQGWKGDWDHRIARLDAKKRKAK